LTGEDRSSGSPTDAPRLEGVGIRPPIGLRNLKVPFFSALLLFGLTQAGVPRSAVAQTVRGHLYDAETGEPVSNGTIALKGSLGTVVDRTAADSLGAYSLNAPRPGRYSLLATALGYQSTSTLAFDVGAEGPTTFDIRLEPEPIELDSLGVEAGLRSSGWMASRWTRKPPSASTSRLAISRLLRSFSARPGSHSNTESWTANASCSSGRKASNGS